MGREAYPSWSWRSVFHRCPHSGRDQVTGSVQPAGAVPFPVAGRLPAGVCAHRPLPRQNEWLSPLHSPSSLPSCCSRPPLEESRLNLFRWANSSTKRCEAEEGGRNWGRVDGRRAGSDQAPTHSEDPNGRLHSVLRYKDEWVHSLHSELLRVGWPEKNVVSMRY